MMATIVGRDRWAAPGGWTATGPMRLPAARLWVHHGATGSPTLATLRAYHRYHRSLGWAGLGYSYAIVADGTIYEGRGTRLGAHTSGDNGRSFGVVLVGDWTRGTVPQPMVAALADLVRHLHATGALAHPAITGGHRDAPGASTACPGAAGMDAVRRARLLLAHPPTTAAPSPPTGTLTIEAFMATLTPDEQARLRELASYLAGPHGTRGDSFARQLLEFHRHERPAVQQLIHHLDDVGSSVQGLVRGSIGFIRRARQELGWTLPTDR